MTIPPFREIFIAENGQVFIEPIGGEPGVRQLVNQIATTSSEGLNLKKIQTAQYVLKVGLIAHSLMQIKMSV